MEPSPVSLSPAMVSLIWHEPLLMPPSGEVANMVDPPNEWGPTLAALVVEYAFIVTTYVLRMYMKIYLNRRIHLEDVLISIAIVFYITMTAIVVPGVELGFGWHAWNITYGTLTDLLYRADTIEILYGFTMLLVKLAIFLQFLRFFVPQRAGNELMWWTLWSFIVIHTGYYLSTALVFIFGCTPREKLWQPVMVGSCVDLNTLIMASAYINMISDFAVLILPTYRVWKLQMSRTKKLGLTAVFAVGAIGCVSSVLRTTTSYQFVQMTDITFSMYWMGFWASLELACGIFASNVPLCVAVFRFRQTQQRRRYKYTVPTDLEFNTATTTSETTIEAYCKRSTPGYPKALEPAIVQYKSPRKDTYPKALEPAVVRQQPLNEDDLPILSELE